MGYRDRINRATAYIEANLNRDIKAAEVAREAAYSLFHFHRIFLAATGDTLKAYIRMRQMTRAARRLIETDTGIIDIALDAGFDSQEAFTRAFKKVFGIPPGKYRKQNRHYPSVYKNRFNFDLCLKGGCDMTPEIKEKKGFKIVGLRYFGANENNGIPKIWDELLERGGEIRHLDNPKHYYGLCSVPEEGGEPGEQFEYIAGRAVTRLADIPDNMVGREVPAGRYAVFTHTGSLDNLKETYACIYGEWAKTEGVEILSGAYDFEFYSEDFHPSGSENSKLYIYVPVK